MEQNKVGIEDLPTMFQKSEVDDLHWSTFL